MLSKSNRTDSAQLGDHPERLLDTQTADGFAIRALYTAFDELPEPPLPGQWPFVRGGDPLRDVHSGWKVAEAFPANGATADTNAAVLAALGEGVSALLIRVGESGVAPDRLTALLSGVYLNLAPVILDAGADYRPACDVMLALVAQLDPGQRDTLSIDLGADPLTASLRDRPAPPIEEVVAVASRAAGERGLRAITVDGPAFHNLGATAATELAATVAAAVAYLRVLTESGLVVSDALRQISFRLAADDDQFMTLAKMRALRQLWARVAEVVGDPGGGAAVVHAETSLPMMTQRDPWVNMLRCTLAAFGAGVGGADTVLVHPFDVAIPGGFPGTAAGFARRIARNTQLLLLEESHVAGCSIPPAGRGSSKSSPTGWLGAPGSVSRPSRPVAASSRPTTSWPARSPSAPPAAPTTSPIGAWRSPASTNTRTWANPRCRPVIRHRRCAATLPDSKHCAIDPITT